jgi:hypothetical protein
MEDLHLDDEDLSNLTDDTNFSSLLLSKSPAMLDSDGFIEDMSLPEVIYDAITLSFILPSLIRVFLMLNFFHS